MSTTKEKPANTLAEAAVAIGKLPQKAQYKSAAALVEAAAPGTPRRVATSVRGVLRSADEGVGRGNRYATITPQHWSGLYKTQQAAKSQKKATVAKAKADKKETVKA